MLSLNMGNLLACSASSADAALHDPDYSPGPEELMGFGDLSGLQLQRSCSQEANQASSHSDPNSKGLGLMHLFRTESEEKAIAEEKPSAFSKLASVFKKTKKEKKAEKKAAMKEAAAKTAPVPVVIDDRSGFGLAQLTLINADAKSAISRMPLNALLVELGTLTGIKSVRLAEVERLAREAEARVKEMLKLEAEMKQAHAAVAASAPAPVSASAVPAAPVASTIIVGDAAPTAPSMSGFENYDARPQDAQKKAWAKGVGYGYHGAASNFSIDDYIAKQKVKQQSVQHILRKISERLIDNEEATFDSLAQSTLMPFLEAYLCNDSMAEILEQNADLYSDIFSLVAHILAVEAPKVSPFTSLLEPKIAGFIRKIAKSAALIEKVDSKHFAPAAQPAASSSSSSSSSSPKPAAPFTLTSFVIELSHTLDAILALPKATPASAQAQPVEAVVVAGVEASTDREDSVSSSASTASSSSSDEAAAPAMSIDGSKASSTEMSEYVKSLTELRFGEVEDFVAHKYMKENSKSASSSSAPISRAFTRRLAVEFADLAESLPIHYDSSVWMRVHESQMQYAQVMISGPDNTPYENGLFLFDVYFPPTYPTVPPQVNLCTTGKSSVRFNPNLYHCGKVCLSILGTWAGGVGEGWSAKTSTFLQVAVSIQSLVFVPDPYFNEPGYESTMHTPAGKAASEDYSNPLLHGTIKWAMIDQMQNPPKGFEEIVKRHFRTKKERIRAQAEAWSKKNATIVPLISELKAEFAKLEKVEA